MSVAVNQTDDLEKAEDDMLTGVVSDEALEVAGEGPNPTDTTLTIQWLTVVCC